jgi:hypothetical protein
MRGIAGAEPSLVLARSKLALEPHKDLTMPCNLKEGQMARNKGRIFTRLAGRQPVPLSLTSEPQPSHWDVV